jgi:hypothetical protein
MRNPMNSWEKSDSFVPCYIKARHHECEVNQKCVYYFSDGKPYKKDDIIGPNDLDLMTRLRKAGTDHRKFMRMITVYLDITAPLYWWKEFDTYKVGTVANSCSTMHKIHAKEFTLGDFSYEHMLSDDHPDEFDFEIMGSDDVWSSKNILDLTIIALNTYRKNILKPKTKNIGGK